MARVKANLMDENDEFVRSLEIDSDEEYHANGWFETSDGAIYVIAEVRPGEPPVDIELDARWMDGPPPAPVGGHS